MYTLTFAYVAFVLSHTHIDVIIDLLIYSSMCICISVAFASFFLCELYKVASRNSIKISFSFSLF